MQKQGIGKIKKIRIKNEIEGNNNFKLKLYAKIEVCYYTQLDIKYNFSCFMNFTFVFEFCHLLKYLRLFNIYIPWCLNNFILYFVVLTIIETSN